MTTADRVAATTSTSRSTPMTTSIASMKDVGSYFIYVCLLFLCFFN